MNNSINNRKIEEIMEDMTAFMELVEQQNKDFHDRCEEHKCKMCIGE
jgi:hypothetical protein